MPTPKAWTDAAAAILLRERKSAMTPTEIHNPINCWCGSAHTEPRQPATTAGRDLLESLWVYTPGGGPMSRDSLPHEVWLSVAGSKAAQDAIRQRIVRIEAEARASDGSLWTALDNIVGLVNELRRNGYNGYQSQIGCIEDQALTALASADAEGSAEPASAGSPQTTGHGGGEWRQWIWSRRAGDE